MKKVFIILLGLCMVLSLSGTVMAEDLDDPQQSTIEYQAEHTKMVYAIDVTSRVNLSNDEIGYVNVTNGYWGPYQILSVTTDDTVTMTDTMDSSENPTSVLLSVDFTDIYECGKYQFLDGGIDIRRPFTVDADNVMDSYKFGKWEGVLTFEVEPIDNANYATVASAKELKEVLNTFSDAGSGDGVINIANDITLAEGETWTPIVIDGYNGAGVITINGNGKTISGLTAPLLAGGFAGSSGIVINDLTIANSEIVWEDQGKATGTDTGGGAFINAVDSMQTITLTNCHLKDSTITTNTRTGGLIGWNSGYDGNGAVKTQVTITDCTVDNCKITGDGTVGGIVGHAGANQWTWNTITNCVVKNCKLTSNDDSYRVGAIVGTANVGDVTISGCTSENNTLKQNNSGTEIARPTGQSDLYGRFVPGSTGKLTIDGTEIE